jgi:hypothetical protein
MGMLGYSLGFYTTVAMLENQNVYMDLAKIS